MRLRLGNKHHLRKTADRKAQIRNVFVSLTELICAFRSGGFLRWCLFPKRNFTHNLFFYFQSGRRSCSLSNLTMTSGIRPSRTLNPLAPIFTPRQPLTITQSDSTHDLDVISQLNCQGFLKKMDMIFNFMITDWKSDIICFSETWLRPSSTVDAHLTKENFTLFCRDRPSRSQSGLLVYTRNHVQVRRHSDLELRELECITLELTVPSPITLTSAVLVLSTPRPTF